ncbi:hypothetical protein [Enterococcus avium]|uniref:hypothetical protein n=1 Tax=Enterococcus avium TaxID=33945 RepID=UPI003DA344B5
MSRPLMLYIPDDTRAITVSVVVRQPDGSAILKTVGVDTQQIKEGRDVEIEVTPDD